MHPVSIGELRLSQPCGIKRKLGHDRVVLPHRRPRRGEEESLSPTVSRGTDASPTKRILSLFSRPWHEYCFRKPERPVVEFQLRTCFFRSFPRPRFLIASSLFLENAVRAARETPRLGEALHPFLLRWPARVLALGDSFFTSTKTLYARSCGR